MHMRAATPLLGALAATALLSGCLGVDNMADFKAALGFQPEPLQLHAPIARLRASPTLATVALPVAFSAQGSTDPQNLPLSFGWDFGDGASAEGSDVSHRFVSAGTFTVTLRASDAAGLTGADTLLITVLDNKAPVITALSIAKGAEAVVRARVNDDLVFHAEARDPEGQPLSLRWDFGDGSTAITNDAHHTYAKGGNYQVTLRAEDPTGLSATLKQALAIDQVLGGQGDVKVGKDLEPHALDVSAAAQHVKVTVPFDPMYGVNALKVSLVDPQGNTVASIAGPALLTQAPFSLVLDLAADKLANHAPGSWVLLVERQSGLDVPYTFAAEVAY